MNSINCDTDKEGLKPVLKELKRMQKTGLIHTIEEPQEYYFSGKATGHYKISIQTDLSIETLDAHFYCLFNFTADFYEG